MVVFIAMSGRYLSLILVLLAGSAWGKVPVDRTDYQEKSPIKVEEKDSVLRATWDTDHGAAAIAFSLEADSPLLATMGIGGKVLASKIDPQIIVTTGVRKKVPGN